jgi:hypothetical protein
MGKITTIRVSEETAKKLKLRKEALGCKTLEEVILSGIEHLGVKNVEEFIMDASPPEVSFKLKQKEAKQFPTGLIYM